METFEANLGVFVQWLLRATLQGSLLVCLIMLIKLILRERLPARWHYCLWLILLIRLALPWAPPSRISIYGLIPGSSSAYRAISGLLAVRFDEAEGRSSTSIREGIAKRASVADQRRTSEPAQSGAADPAALQPSEKTSASAQGPSPRASSRDHRVIGPVISMLTWVWLAGVICLAGYTLIRALGLWRAVASERPVTDQQILELLEDCKMQMQVRTLVGVVVTDKVQSPALFGFLRPRILLPEGLVETLGLDGLHHVFLHELAHLKRRDIYLAWLVCLLQVLHWFNPLIWFAFRRMRADQEMAADALALATAGAEESHRYGQTILNLLERFSRPQYLPSLAGILENPSHIERRVVMITQFKSNSYGWSPLAVSLIVALCCISLPNARPGKAAESSAATPTGAPVAGEQSATLVAEGSNVFVDPNTGIRFTKLRTISGPSDVIINSDLTRSPNGRLLLWHAHFIPLDDGVPFDPVDIPYAHGGSWSPDGRNVVFYAGAIWLIRVDPETARPVGSARKLLDGDYGAQAPVRWSSDSKRIVFRRWDSQIRNEIWALTIENGELSEVTDPFDFGLVSPDGKTVACSEGQGVINQNALLVKPVAGGEAQKIKDGVYPVAWSADSQWLLCKPRVGGGWGDVIRFVRIADGREAEVISPGYLITPSPQGGKLVFYHGSYDWRNTLKVISAAGGPATEFGWPSLSFAGTPGYQLWTGDSQSIVVKGERKGGGWGLWAIPLDGKDPRSLTIDTPLCRPSPDGSDVRSINWLFSPDGSKLLLIVPQGNGTCDLWVIPISLSEMRSTGTAVKVFGGQVPSSWIWWSDLDLWSPDGKRIAFSHKRDIWVASADGKSVIQLTKKPPQDPLTLEWDSWPDWSPDGATIVFCTQSAAKTNVLVRVVPASGGEARVITDVCPVGYTEPRFYAWSPDGKELTIASEREGIISNFPISGGDAKTIVRLKDLGIDSAGWLRWSPDGRALGFQGTEGGTPKVYVYQPDNAKLERLDCGAPGDVAPWYWSRDGKWISFFAEQAVKTRPEGVLWEMDVAEAITKLAK